MTTRGITILAGGVRDTERAAVEAELAGFDAAWTSEFLNRSATISAAAMVAATSTIEVGTAIAYAVGRSPLVLANDALAIDELSGGRFTLGLGTGTRRMMEGWHGVRDPDGPATRLEELVPLLRRLWRLHEGPVQHHGRFFDLDITPTADMDAPLRSDIPVYTAGVNERMIETAGRVSDGLVCHPTATDAYLDNVVRPAIARGTKHSDRSPADVALVGIVICAISDDVTSARREAAAQIAFYTAPKSYGPAMAKSGYAAEAEAIREAFGRRDIDAMVAAVTDDMINEMSVAGTPNDVRAAFASFEQRYDHVALYSPSFTMTPARVAANTDAIIETFRRPSTDASQ